MLDDSFGVALHNMPKLKDQEWQWDSEIAASGLTYTMVLSKPQQVVPGPNLPKEVT